MSRILHIFLSSLVFVSSLAVAVAEASINDPVKSEQRASQERTVKLLREIKRLKSPEAANRPCVAVQSCAKNCLSRFADGSCGSYGPDFCALDASCSAQCLSRFDDGSCGNYGPDFCGTDAQCSPDCTARFADGTCGNYGPDVCF